MGLIFPLTFGFPFRNNGEKGKISPKVAYSVGLQKMCSGDMNGYSFHGFGSASYYV